MYTNETSAEQLVKCVQVFLKNPQKVNLDSCRLVVYVLLFVCVRELMKREGEALNVYLKQAVGTRGHFR